MKSTAVNTRGTVFMALSISILIYEFSCMRFTLEFSMMQCSAFFEKMMTFLLSDKNIIPSLSPPLTDCQEAQKQNPLFNFINYGEL